MEYGREEWNGKELLRCSRCEKEVGEGRGFSAEIQEWNGEKKIFCESCFNRWLRDE
jgi:DNA-directed RNA polymerase subunit RPC12/RpoP